MKHKISAKLRLQTNFDTTKDLSFEVTTFLDDLASERDTNCVAYTKQAYTFQSGSIFRRLQFQSNCFSSD